MVASFSKENLTKKTLGNTSSLEGANAIVDNFFASLTATASINATAVATATQAPISPMSKVVTVVENHNNVDLGKVAINKPGTVQGGNMFERDSVNTPRSLVIDMKKDPVTQQMTRDGQYKVIWKLVAGKFKSTTVDTVLNGNKFKIWLINGVILSEVTAVAIPYIQIGTKITGQNSGCKCNGSFTLECTNIIEIKVH